MNLRFQPILVQSRVSLLFILYTFYMIIIIIYDNDDNDDKVKSYPD